MTRLAFDIYDPPTDPSLGTRRARLTGAELGPGSFYRHTLGGIGTGRIVVERGQSFVTAAIMRTGNYVVVRDLDLSATDTLNVIGGWTLQTGDFAVVEDPGRGVLEFGGPSTKALLADAIMGPESLSPFEGPYSIVDGYWRWGSDVYGGVLRRAILEANLQDPPGLPMIDIGVSGGVIVGDGLNWDDSGDSNGDPWPSFAGEFRTQAGTDLLALLIELYGYGVETDIDARTFDMYAYNAGGFGDDLTGGAFGAGVVRFVGGVNIGRRLERHIQGRLPLTHVLVRTVDHPEGAWIESASYSPGDPVRKAPYQTGDISGDPASSTALQERAQRMMDIRGLAEDGIEFHTIKPGDDEANGRYTPGPHYANGATPTAGHFWVGDYVTVHSGTSDVDYNNATKRVESITYEMAEAADDDDGGWNVVIGIGPRIGSGTTSGIPSISAVPLPFELCRPTIAPGDPIPGTELLSAFWDFESDNSDATNTYNFMEGRWHNPYALTGWWGFNGGGDISQSSPKFSCSPGQTVHLVGDFSKQRAASVIASSMQVRWFVGTGSPTPASHATVAIPASGSGLGVIGHVDETLIVPAGIGAFAIFIGDNVFGNDITVTLIDDDAGPGDAGELGAGHVDLVGTSTAVKRCDSRSYVNREAVPTATDDLEHGYPAGTEWRVFDDVDDPTVITAVYVSIVDDNGAAVWQRIYPGDPLGITVSEDGGDSAPGVTSIIFDGATVTDNGDGSALVEVSAAGGAAPDTADYLVGTAQAGLSGEIVVGTSPGGELGGTWASPTVDATHSGSTHASRGPANADYLVGTANGELSAEIVVGTTPGGELGGTWASPTVDATHSGSAHHNENHQSRHNTGGADALKLDDLAAPDDNTDLNASTSAHGLLKKLSGSTSEFLRADGSWAAPAGGGSGGTGVATANLFIGTVDPYEVTGVGTALVANQAYFAKICPSKDVTVSQAVFRVVTQAGNLDFGIYDASFNRLVSTGSFACPAAPGGGFNTQAFSGGATQLLQAGVVYYLAMAASSTTFRCPVKVPNGASTVLGHGWALRGSMASALPLPNPATPSMDTSSTLLLPIFLVS